MEIKDQEDVEVKEVVKVNLEREVFVDLKDQEENQVLKDQMDQEEKEVNVVIKDQEVLQVTNVKKKFSDYLLKNI